MVLESGKSLGTLFPLGEIESEDAWPSATAPSIVSLIHFMATGLEKRADVLNISSTTGPDSEVLSTLSDYLLDETGNTQVLTAISAGNEGKLNYFGAYRNSDNDPEGWNDFADAGEPIRNAIELRKLNTSASIFVYWDRFDCDFAVEVQHGLKSHDGVKVSDSQAMRRVRVKPIIGGTYSIRVRPRVVCPAQATIHVWVGSNDIDAELAPGTNQFSVVGLAAHPLVLTVGSFDRTDAGFEFVPEYSSRGGAHNPAWMGHPVGFVTALEKPEILAPGTVGDFRGTSVAAPHVAGAASLLVEAYRAENDLPLDQPPLSDEKARIREKLLELARPLKTESGVATGPKRLNLVAPKLFGIDSGSRIRLFSHVGETLQPPWGTFGMIYAADVEPGSGALWVIDVAADKVVRVDRDGKRAEFLAEPSSGFFDTVAYDPVRRVCWVAFRPGGTSTLSTDLLALRHVPAEDGAGESRLEPEPELSDTIGGWVRFLAVDPKRDLLWSSVEFRQPDQPTERVIWRRALPETGHFLDWTRTASTAHTLAVDSTDGSVWSAYLGELRRLSVDGSEIGRLPAPPNDSYRGISLDQGTRELWARLTFSWSKYSTTPATAELQLQHSVDTYIIEGRRSRTADGQVSAFDGSYWALNGDPFFRNTLLRHLPPHKAIDDEPLHADIETQPLGNIRPYLALPDMTDDDAVPEPTPVPTPVPTPTPPISVGAVLSQGAASNWDELPEVEEMEAEAAAEGLSLVDWARADQGRLTRLVDAIRDHRRSGGTFR